MYLPSVCGLQLMIIYGIDQLMPVFLTWSDSPCMNSKTLQAVLTKTWLYSSQKFQTIIILSYSLIRLVEPCGSNCAVHSKNLKDCLQLKLKGTICVQFASSRSKRKCFKVGKSSLTLLHQLCGFLSGNKTSFLEINDFRPFFDFANILSVFKFLPTKCHLCRNNARSCAAIDKWLPSTKPLFQNLRLQNKD